MIMTAKKYIRFIFSFALYTLAILINGVIPIRLTSENFSDFEYILYAIIVPIVLSLIAFSILKDIIFISKKRRQVITLFCMIYFALILGTNNVYDFVLLKLIYYYENHNLTETVQYEQLWNHWSNDLSRNLMYFGAIFYSLFASLLYVIFSKFIKKE